MAIDDFELRGYSYDNKGYKRAADGTTQYHWKKDSTDTHHNHECNLLGKEEGEKRIAAGNKSGSTIV